MIMLGSENSQTVHQKSTKLIRRKFDVLTVLLLVDRCAHSCLMTSKSNILFLDLLSSARRETSQARPANIPFTHHTKVTAVCIISPAVNSHVSEH